MERQEKFWQYILEGDNQQSVSEQSSTEDVQDVRLKLYAISNPDGTTRWVFPINSKAPLFLKFYAQNTLRSRAFAFFLKVLFYFGLIRLVARKFSFSLTRSPFYYKWLADPQGANFAMFSGTVGPNRKIVIYEKQNGKGVFTKVPFGPNSDELIFNEAYNLKNLQQNGLTSIQFPETIAYSQDCLTMHELKRKRAFKFDINPLMDFEDEKARIFDVYSSTNWAVKIQKRLEGDIQNLDHIGPLEELKHKIVGVMEGLKDKSLPLVFAHGDFTPWNTFSNEDGLVVLDWENAGKFPMLYDVFHYITQGAIMHQGDSADSIYLKVESIMDTQKCKEFLAKHSLNWRELYSFYLVYLSSYYYEVYAKQGKLHYQALEALKVWIELFNHTEVFIVTGSYRKTMINETMSFISTYRYALLKNQENKMELLAEKSDLDLAIEKKDRSSMVAFFIQHPLVSKYQIRNSSYMTVVTLFLKDGSFLSIDLIFSLKRKFIEYLSVKDLLSNRRMNKQGIYVPQLHDDLLYIILFYFLNGSSIPMKYASFFSGNRRKQQTLFNHLKLRLGFRAKQLEDLFDDARVSEVRNDLNKVILKKSINLGFNLLVNKILYVIDVLRIKASNQGMVISFSGVDGAGKSTILNEVKSTLTKKYRKNVVVLRHRPSVFPILSAWIYGKKGAEEKAVARLPRTGQNKSVMGSLLRFTYYFLDYMLGHFVIKFKYTLWGVTVLYDRYYFDFISDERRTNLVLPKGLARILYWMVPKPDVNIFLYASPEVILARKQELDKESIETLTNKYKALFEDLSNNYSEVYRPIENIDIERTINRVEQLIVEAA